MHVSLGFMVYNNQPCPWSQVVFHYIYPLRTLSMAVIIYPPAYTVCNANYYHKLLYMVLPRITIQQLILHNNNKTEIQLNTLSPVAF